MEATVRFKGWTPSPRAVVVGMERDNKVFTLRFEGLPVYHGGTTYLHIDLGSAGADSIEIVNGLAEITRNITQYEDEKTAYVEIIANNDVVWHSDQMLIYVNPLPLVSGKIEQAYPTAFEQALAQTAADKAAAAKSAADAAATAAGIVTEEAARQDAESKRVAAETARGQAEKTRAEHERLREDAENERVKAENARETAEANREQAEEAREQEMADALEGVASAENTVQANEQQRVLAERTRAAQEQARQSAEQSRVEAEQSRVEAEQARAQAEQRRETAETSRAEAERQRESMETSRQTAETARNAAENGRAKAEKTRETAESQRQQAETARADAESKRVQAEQGRVTAEQKRVEAETQREEAMAQHAEKIAELEAEVAKKAKIDDTTVSGTEAWSSQHVVDMLCPPLEASGNPVVCYPVAGSKLGVTASWEPTQEGEGTPSPDNIRPIRGRTQVMVERCGENILNISPNNQLTGNPSITNDDGWISIDGTLGSGNLYLAINFTLQPGTYFGYLFGGNSIAGNGVVWFYGGGIAQFVTPNSRGAKLNVTTVTTINVYLHVDKKFELTEKFAVSIISGSTAPTAYTPYIGSTTTLTLPSTIYGADLQADGEGKETWKLLTLTGTEGWGYDPRGFFTHILAEKARNATVPLCDRYTGKTVATAEGLYTEGQYLVIGTSVCGFTTVDEWKAYLAAQYAAGTPVQVAYKLATPVPFAATGGGTIKALPGTNTILTDADTLTVTGRADPIRIIQQLQAASAASAQALADVERAVTDI